LGRSKEKEISFVPGIKNLHSKLNCLEIFIFIMTTRLLICIPSKARHNDILNNTLSWLQYTIVPYKIFVEPQDWQNYFNVLQPFGYQTKLVKLPKNDMGINYARWFIRNYCYSNDIDYIFQMDDDVFSLRDPATRGMGSSAPRVDKRYRCLKIFEPLVQHCIEALDTIKEVGAISLMYGQDMIHFDGERWKAVNKRLQTNYIIRTKYYHTDGCEKFRGAFADFTAFFNVINSGLITLQYGLTGFDVRPVGVYKGGLQNFDRAQAVLLQKQFIENKFPWVIWKQVTGKNWDWEPDIRKSLKNFNKQ
jgi:hypothetical protein